MAYIPMEQIRNRYENFYKVVLLASKRASELSEGANPLISDAKRFSKITSVALEEIQQGKVDLNQEEAKPAKKVKGKKDK